MPEKNNLTRKTAIKIKLQFNRNKKEEEAFFLC